MRYISTRGEMDPAPFSDVVIGGLAPDGGLTLPEKYPQFDISAIREMAKLPYQDLAFKILGRYASDIPEEDISSLIGKTYTKENFGASEITPVVEISDGIYLLDLSNGPTLSFKDIALQFLGNLFEYLLNKRGDYLNILGATSGDTGSSAEEAVRGKSNMNIFMISPYGKTSPFQAAQMYSLWDPNIFNIALLGVFDDGQKLVKGANKDGAFKRKYHLGAVNSINWARVAAQVVYYFKGYFAVSPNADQVVDFSVPTGNFGDIFAGDIARRMGLPIRRLVLATNENNILDEFFKTGVYRTWERKGVIETSSPSQDISKASNFERFLYHLFANDPALTKMYMEGVEDKGIIDLGKTFYFDLAKKSGYVSGSSTHENRLETIRKVYGDSKVIIDPHTANGIKVGQEYRDQGVPLICLGTAKPTKFEPTIKEALGFVPPRPKEFDDLGDMPQRYKIMENDLAALKQHIAGNALKK